MARKIIVVIGATGQQGGSVARTFAKLPDWEVRGITRNTSSDSAKALRNAGIETIAADLDDRSSLDRAFVGASVIFGVTDFHQFMNDPRAHQLVEEKGIDLAQACEALEIDQGKNLADAAANVPGLERFVFSPLANVKKWSKGKYTNMYHFDGKAAVVGYVESALPQLAAKMSQIQLGIYLDNWKSIGAAIYTPRKQSDGSFIFPPPGLNPELRSCIWVLPSNDTGPVVKALVQNTPPRTIVSAGVRSTFAEWAATWGKVNGKECKYVPMPKEEFEKFLPGPIGDDLYNSFLFLTEFGQSGGDPEVKSMQDIGVDMDEVMNVEKYIRSQDWSVVF